jgi:hypothetical protein
METVTAAAARSSQGGVRAALTNLKGVMGMTLNESTMKLLEGWAFAEYLRVRAAEGKADHDDAALAAADAAADRFALDRESMAEIYDRLLDHGEEWAEFELDVVRGWRTNYELGLSEWLDRFFASASAAQRMQLITASSNTQADAEAKLAALGK